MSQPEHPIEKRLSEVSRDLNQFRERRLADRRFRPRDTADRRVTASQTLKAIQDALQERSASTPPPEDKA
jgi:hypothetical protein